FYSFITALFWLLPFSAVVRMQRRVSSQETLGYFSPRLLGGGVLLLLFWTGYSAFGYVPPLESTPHLNGFLQAVATSNPPFLAAVFTGVVWYAAVLSVPTPIANPEHS